MVEFVTNEVGRAALLPTTGAIAPLSRGARGTV